MRTAILTTAKNTKQFNIPEAADWDELARLLASQLKPGNVLVLSGPLGAGKTTFVQSLAKALGVLRVPQSPTFALMRGYPVPRNKQGITRLIHVDAYRIEDERDLMVLDLDEELADDHSVLVVEWPEKIPQWLETRPNVLRLEIR